MTTPHRVGVFCALILCCRGLGVFAQSTNAAVTGETAILAWSAFECSVYAEMSGRPAKDHERLFQLGYDNGKRFLEAARAGRVTQEEIREKVPISVTMHASGPTVDFALGRIFEVVSTDAYDRVVKRDFSGEPLPVGKWLLDDEIKKTRSATEYRTRNCALLK